MKRAIRVGLLAAIATTLTIGVIEAAFAKTENDFFQFCTTKAYGWPAPWKINYCECEGSKTVFPNVNKVVNLGAVAGSGLASFVLFGTFSFLRSRKY